jgi:hypothetical protein
MVIIKCLQSEKRIVVMKTVVNFESSPGGNNIVRGFVQTSAQNVFVIETYIALFKTAWWNSGSRSPDKRHAASSVPKDICNHWRETSQRTMRRSMACS